MFLNDFEENLIFKGSSIDQFHARVLNKYIDDHIINIGVYCILLISYKIKFIKICLTTFKMRQ
ncbi:hypothetical protein NUSPORA_01403 [Nucleospora cyclopteri]